MPLFKTKSTSSAPAKVEVITKPLLFKAPKTTLIPLAELENFLEQEQRNGHKTLRSWYEKLHEETAKEAKESDKASLCGTILGNANKNRYKNLIPYDKYRVILGRTWTDFREQQTVDSSCHAVVGNYINASYIGACNMQENGEVLPQESITDAKFIATQDPLDSTVGDFWKMVYEQRSPIIINLTGAVNENECQVFWPPTVGKKSVYSTGGSRIWVELIKEEQKPVWLERSIKIWPDGYQHLCMYVRLMQYMGWAINYPPATSNLLKFIDDVANPAVPIASTAGPTIVQCRGGIGRNGFFISAWILKQNIEYNMKGVDIFNMIKHLRRYRVGFVNSVEYFIALHKFALQIYNLIPKGGYKSIEYLKV